jgi:hypothetical protein
MESETDPTAVGLNVTETEHELPGAILDWQVFAVMVNTCPVDICIELIVSDAVPEFVSMKDSTALGVATG